MKVLMISTDLALAGAKVTTGDAVKRHIDYGSNVDRLDIIVFSFGNYQDANLSENVFIYPTNSNSKLGMFFDSIKLAKGLGHKFNYDLVVCQDPFLTGLAGLRLKKILKSKLLVHFHGDFWSNSYWWQENYLRLGLLVISRFVINRADYIRTVSAGIKSKLIKAGVLKHKIKVVSTPVDLDYFKQPDLETVSSIKSEYKGKKIILWAGKIRQEKNIILLIKVFKQLLYKYKDAVLLLAGSGRDYNKIDKFRLQIGVTDEVKLLGHVSKSMLVNYFHAADIFVLPSRHESLGKVLLEAAMASKAVVASKTTGAKEIIKDDKTGFLVGVNNQEQLQQKLLKLLQDDNLRVKMGKNFYDDVVKRFDYNRQVKEVVNYWREIVGED